MHITKVNISKCITLKSIYIKIRINKPYISKFISLKSLYQNSYMYFSECKNDSAMGWYSQTYKIHAKERKSWLHIFNIIWWSESNNYQTMWALQITHIYLFAWLAVFIWASEVHVLKIKNPSCTIISPYNNIGRGLSCSVLHRGVNHGAYKVQMHN